MIGIHKEVIAMVLVTFVVSLLAMLSLDFVDAKKIPESICTVVFSMACVINVTHCFLATDAVSW